MTVYEAFEKAKELNPILPFEERYGYCEDYNNQGPAFLFYTKGPKGRKEIGVGVNPGVIVVSKNTGDFLDWYSLGVVEFEIEERDFKIPNDSDYRKRSIIHDLFSKRL